MARQSVEIRSNTFLVAVQFDGLVDVDYAKVKLAECLRDDRQLDALGIQVAQVLTLREFEQSASEAR